MIGVDQTVTTDWREVEKARIKVVGRVKNSVFKINNSLMQYF